MMALPAGFTLEQPQALAMQLPAGFQLEAQQPMQVGTGAAAIPGQRSISEEEKPESLSDRIAGLIEIPAAAAAGALTSVAAPIAGIYGTLTSGKFGTPEGIQAGQQVAQRVQQWSQPQTRTAQEFFRAIAPVMESMGAMGPNINAMNLGQNQLGAATRVVGDRFNALRTPERAVMGQTVQARNADWIGQRVAESNANAPIIDGTKAAHRIGYVVDPAVTNPNRANKIKGTIVGPQFDELATEANAAKTTEVVRKDLSVAPDQLLDAAAVETALDKASVGYEPVRKMESLSIPDESVKSLESLRKQAPIGGDAKTAATNSLIDDALAKLQKTTSSAFSGVGGERTHVGRSGAMILDDIRSMRRDAQAIYKAQKINPDPLAIAKADTQMSIAKILEDVVDANASSPKILSDMRKSRTRMAQIYDHDLAIDYASQTVDPQVYAKLLNERKGNMTGVGADIGKAAATFPNIITTQAPTASVLPTVKRSGVGAVIGAVLGGAIGNYPGAIAGAGAGAAAGSLGARSMARNMLMPEYQAARAMPVDYRPAPSNLRPADINYGPNQMVPYDFAQATTQAPNFVLRPNQYPPKATFAGPETGGPPQLGYGGTMETLANERARAAAMSRTLGQQAETGQAAAEAATRQTTRGGQVIEVDPVTGKMTLGAEGTAGMTPNTQVIESTGASLASASKKVAESKLFDFTAEEKIAWAKTKADLAEVAPGFSKLTDKALAEKMMDRAWIQETVTKANEKARMLDDIIDRSNNVRLRQDAMVKREQLNSTIEALEEQFRKARPAKTGAQGPKTRAAQRNALIPEENRIILNNMAPSRP